VEATRASGEPARALPLANLGELVVPTSVGAFAGRYAPEQLAVMRARRADAGDLAARLGLVDDDARAALDGALGRTPPGEATTAARVLALVLQLVAMMRKRGDRGALPVATAAQLVEENAGKAGDARLAALARDVGAAIAGDVALGAVTADLSTTLSVRGG
jgi:hypothetical protein